MSETGQPENPNDESGQHSEQVRVQHLSARVPENVSRGAFSTGAIVMTGGTEFIIDFIQNLGTPGGRGRPRDRAARRHAAVHRGAAEEPGDVPAAVRRAAADAARTRRRRGSRRRRRSTTS